MVFARRGHRPAGLLDKVSLKYILDQNNILFIDFINL